MPIQHGDYAVWQHELLRRGDFRRGLAYWEEKLRGAPRCSSFRRIGLDLPSCPTVAQSGASRSRKRLTQALRGCSRQEKVSLFTIFAAALNVLLYRYTGQDDILLGIPLADRDRPELQTVIGFLLHTHVLRTQLDGDLSFRELLLRVQRDSA